MSVSTDTQSPIASNEAPWEELRARLHRFVSRRVGGDTWLHDDLVQDILVRLHRGLPMLREHERLDAFAYQVARNVIADHFRRARPEQPTDPTTIAEQSSVEDGAIDEEDRGEGRAMLARCLQPLAERLPRDYREALLLTDLGELSQAEAARELGLSAPGMRSRVQRGRVQLHQALTDCCRVELDAATQIDGVERTGPCACG